MYTYEKEIYKQGRQGDASSCLGFFHYNDLPVARHYDDITLITFSLWATFIIDFIDLNMILLLPLNLK